MEYTVDITKKKEPKEGIDFWRVGNDFKKDYKYLIVIDELTCKITILKVSSALIPDNIDTILNIYNLNNDHTIVGITSSKPTIDFKKGIIDYITYN